MSTFAPSPTPKAIAAAVEALGGSVVPLNSGLRRLGWPFLSRSAVHARRLAGTLPVAPKRLGCRWVIYARDAAPLFETGAAVAEEPVTASQPPLRRGPGRPRKLTAPAGETIGD
jgi:hypothetical protein